MRRKLDAKETDVPTVEQVQGAVDSLDFSDSFDSRAVEDQAHEHAFRAMESTDPEDIVHHAKRALELDPGCVDALSIRAAILSECPEQHMARLQQVVETGRDQLRRKYFSENQGHFWGLVETRPFMRALESLAESHRMVGMDQQAIETLVEMLTLNPNDNQGIRYQLLGLYLKTGQLKAARKLLDQFEGDALSARAWGRTLLIYLEDGAEAAEAALQAAREKNVWAERFLSGEATLPERPPYVEYRGESEGIQIGYELGDAWRTHEDAQRWLRATPRAG